jgi:hypothetical protein
VPSRLPSSTKMIWRIPAGRARRSARRVFANHGLTIVEHWNDDRDHDMEPASGRRTTDVRRLMTRARAPRDGRSRDSNTAIIAA